MAGSQVRFPSVSVSVVNAGATVQNTAQKVLLVGQMTAAGSATDGALVQNISSSGAPENALFGEDSQLAAMIRAFKAVNPVGALDAIALDDDGSGVPRVLDFTIGGSPTAAGSVRVVTGSDVNHSFTVAVASTDTPTDIAAAIVAAVNADAKVPFTAGNVAGAVTLTAVNDGTVANTLGTRVDVSGAPGVSISVALTETTPGSVDPTLTGILDVATDRYQGIVWPFADTSVLETFLAPRFNPTNAVLDGVGFVSKVDSHANHLSDADENDQNLVVFADKAESVVTGDDQYIGPAQNEASYVKSAYFAGIRALRLTDGESIGRFVTANESLDQFGGAALASLPYANTPIDLLPTIPAGFGWTEIEIGQLKAVGRSIIGVNLNGDTGLVGEVVTTYITDAASNPDVTFTFLNYVDTASQVREYRFNNLKARFVQSRLTEGSVSRGRSQANAATIRAFVEKLYQDLAGPDFVLVQDGDAAVAFYKDNLTITLNLASGLVTITDLTPIVTQLREIIMTMKIAFSVEG